MEADRRNAMLIKKSCWEKICLVQFQLYTKYKDFFLLSHLNHNLFLLKLIYRYKKMILRWKCCTCFSVTIFSSQRGVVLNVCTNTRLTCTAYSLLCYARFRMLKMFCARMLFPAFFNYHISLDVLMLQVFRNKNLSCCRRLCLVVDRWYFIFDITISSYQSRYCYFNISVRFFNCPLVM